MSRIGVLNEKPLHASLKRWYAQPGDRFEVPMDGFVIDIVRGDLLVEIQTGSVSSAKSKLTALAQSRPVRLVYPIAQEKWIVKPAGGPRGTVTRRKSPRRGRVEDLFREMVGCPHLLRNGNFSLEVILIREEEARWYNPKGSWRRRGWATEERRLLEVVHRRLFERPGDWRALLPEGLTSFTARDLADELKIANGLAQRMVYLLRHGGIIDLTGRRGRANQYGLPAPSHDAKHVERHPEAVSPWRAT
jgi:hypothetical protein